MPMAHSSKRFSKRSSGLVRSNASKSELSRSSMAEQRTSSAEDRKAVLIRELLCTLLPLCTTKFEIHKNFAELKFCNGNSYTGWLGPQGFQGSGKYKYADGSIYQGSFNRSLPSKSGKLEYDNGDVYAGEMLAGQPHGSGVYRAQNFQLSGNFERGVLHGAGVCKSKTRELRGLFEKGKLVNGAVRDHCGVYEGTFDSSGFRKHGKYTYKNGNTYTGHWKNDLYSGYGVYNWIEETATNLLSEMKYTGYWMNGVSHVLGMLAIRGRFIVSQWKGGKKSGAGVVFSVNGTCYAGVRLFDEDEYRQGFQIRNCLESKAILKDIVKLLDSTTTSDMEGRSDAFTDLVRKLLKDYGDQLSPINPIHIPEYELGNVAPDFCSSDFETDCLQRVLSENYSEFRKLFQDYKSPGDEYLCPLRLNLLYMDIFHSIHDVNIAECMNDAYNTISNLTMSIDGVTALTLKSPVSFYNFFQHIVCITMLLMRNEELRETAAQLQPAKFGLLGVEVLLVLRLLGSWSKPIFYARKALFKSRTGIESLVRSVEDVAGEDKSVRAAYKLLETIGTVDGCALNFKRSVRSYFDGVFEGDRLRDVDFQMSSLELVEIILRSC